MEGKKEKYKGFLELKKHAAEKILRIANNKLFIDIRKVRRFRIWQGEYLDHVMQGIGLKNAEKQDSLREKYLYFLNNLLLKHMQYGLYKWSLWVKYFKIFALPNNKFSAALKISAFLVRTEEKNISRKDFPLFYTKSLSWKNPRIKTALFKWKHKVISTLLSESHHEMAIVKIMHFMHKKITPLTQFAIKKICYRIGAKVGCSSLVILLKKLIHKRKSFGISKLLKRKVNFTPRSRFIREQKAKLLLLQKFAGIKQLIRVVNKRSSINLEKIKVFKAFVKWKRIRRRPQVVRKRVKGANRKLKSLSAIFLISKCKCKSATKRTLARYFCRWNRKLKNGGKSDEFPIDKHVISNQANVAAYIEGQILKKNHLIKDLKKSIRLQNLDFILKKKLKRILDHWDDAIKQEKNRSHEEDIVYEYIHYLESNLGFPHRFKH